jgi:hypothetical protein
MKKILTYLSLLIGLMGCVTTPNTQKNMSPKTPLTLYFSQEQLTLTQEQERQLTELLLFKSTQQKHLNITIRPTNDDDPLIALINSKKRLVSILEITHSFDIKIKQIYQPHQQTNTILLQYE